MSPFLTTLGGGSARGFGRGRRITAAVVVPSGQQLYDTPGTYTFTVPTGVTSVSTAVIGGGAGASFNYYYATMGQGGGGGALAYKNNISVTPGQTVTVVVGAGGAGGVGNNNQYGQDGGASSFTCQGTTYAHAGGGKAPQAAYSGSQNGDGGLFIAGDGGGNGGAGGATGRMESVYGGGGGGGAGGYSGAGGTGGTGAQITNNNTNSGWTGGTNGSGGGGGGGAGAGYTATINVNTLDACGIRGCNESSGRSVGGGGGGTGIKGQGSNGSAGGSIGYAAGAGSSGFRSYGTTPPNFDTGQGGSYGGGAGAEHGGYNLAVCPEVAICQGNAYDEYGECTTYFMYYYICDYIQQNTFRPTGGSGAVRIIWGTGRSYPSAAADV
jgi:hypothetical protein